MVKVKEEVYVPTLNVVNFRCRQCDQQIELTGKDLVADDLKIFHTKCYTQFLLDYKEYGIRIGAKIHKKRSKK